MYISISRLFTLSFILIATLATGQKREAISLEDVWNTRKLAAAGIAGIEHDGSAKYYTTLKRGRIMANSYVNSADTTVVFDQSIAKQQGVSIKMQGYAFSTSGNWVLIETNTNYVYRHSKTAVYYLWNLKSQRLVKVNDGKPVFYASISPDEKNVAFVFENDLYIQNIDNLNLTRVTEDGKENAVMNGKSDWVYEEEFVLVKGFEWSPDGNNISFYRFEEERVSQYQIPVYNGKSYPDFYAYKYPKAGEDNSLLQVYIYNLSSKNKVLAKTGSDENDYLPRMKWIDNENLCITRLNRWQNKLELLKTGLDGQTSVFFTDKSSTYVDVTDDLTFLSDGSFITSSERSGYNHLYHFSSTGQLFTAITSGEFDVTEFYGYDPKSKFLYFQAAHNAAYDRGVYRASLKGGKMQALTSETGNNTASFSADFKYFILNYSDINTPPRYSINDQKGLIVRELVNNDALKKLYSEVGFGQFEIMQFKTDYDVTLNAWLLKPADFNIDKKYPLLMFCYGGPGSQMVMNRWYISNRDYFEYLTTKGFVIACVDNRGTGARGAEFKKMTYLNLGQYEAEDQIAGAKYFGTLPFINASQIGIFGWSYGGYLSCLSLEKGREVFKMAVSVAPVSDWRFYDNIYTERYMRLPSDNPDGYINSSLMKYSDGLRDRKLLLVHGSFDDNVHPQNSLELTRKLVESNIAFDFEYYTNKNHGISGKNTRIHLFRKITTFIEDNLAD